MKIQDRNQIEEIEEIQEVEEEELDINSNRKKKKRFEWVGPTVRKATIASMLIIATPVMIPPTVVLSTIGGALCVPFGVYLGTLAITDKFMSYIFRTRGGEEVRLGFQDDEDENDQVIYTEEEARQQIEIIRAILGYKAPKHYSYIEELNAILRFIGIEPTLSLKVHTDLDEISSTIRLLKSLIGIK